MNGYFVVVMCIFLLHATLHRIKSLSGSRHTEAVAGLQNALEHLESLRDGARGELENCVIHGQDYDV